MTKEMIQELLQMKNVYLTSEGKKVIASILKNSEGVNSTK